LITYFDPPPRPDELPARLPSPFAVPPHALARRAMEALVRALPARPREGKMLGVLVVRDGAGRIGWLRGFSGMLDGRWEVPGFVGPTFDLVARDAFWPAGERALAALDRELAAIGERHAAAAAVLAAIDDDHRRRLADLAELHRARRAARKVARAGGLDEPALHALAQHSRADGAERARLEAAHRDARAEHATAVAELAHELATHATAKTAMSRGLLARIHATYAFANATGRVKTLAELFGDSAPGGAGDCAAPKLFAHASRHALAPLAIAERWWGPPPATGDRADGVYYPACRGKCGPILAHVLDGHDAEPAPVFGADAIDPAEPRVVFEDAWLVVVDKPVGLLSIPGRSAALADCVATRLRARYPDATGPLVVHRLDLETSGLLLAAKDAETHADLQRMFAQRMIAKRYTADLACEPRLREGAIELPLRVDVDDRPRQIVDRTYGKFARTEIVSITGRRAILAPSTGRTHQLRVHCAHPDGLAAPIVGDRLYGEAADRLHLHATSLAFEHPRTHTRIDLTSPPPF